MVKSMTKFILFVAGSAVLAEPTREDMRAVCAKIQERKACDQNCFYAFSDPVIQPLIPDTLIRELCSGEEGKYTALCPSECTPAADDGPTKEQLAPLCAKIKERRACDKTCLYAFSDAALGPLIPTTLAIEVCRGEDGKYTELCPAECPSADDGPTKEEVAPLCAEIKKRRACDKTCQYAFSEAALGSLIPTSLAIEMCRGEDGKYTELCPAECPSADDGPTKEELAPLCAKIKERRACDKTCLYAFSDAALGPLIPTALAIEVCRGEDGKYTELCPAECPSADDGPTKEEVAPLCAEIKKRNACDKTCTYAFGEAELRSLIPDSLAISLCRGDEGRYTSLCSDCPVDACAENKRKRACKAGGCMWRAKTCMKETTSTDGACSTLSRKGCAAEKDRCVWGKSIRKERKCLARRDVVCSSLNKKGLCKKLPAKCGWSNGKCTSL